MPDVAGVRSIRPPPWTGSPSRIEASSSRSTASGRRSLGRPSKRVGELGVAIEAAAAQTFRALASERVCAIGEQAVAGKLQNRVEVATGDCRSDCDDVAASHGGSQLGQRFAVRGAHVFDGVTGGAALPL